MTRLISIFLLCCLTGLIATVLIPVSADAGTPEAADRLPRHTISISFNLEKKLVTGTSKIELPANLPLHLQCGPLKLTGAILEHANRTPVLIKVKKDNTIIIARNDRPGVLYLSWTLKADNPYMDSNLITENGITLAGFWHPIADQDMLFKLFARLPRKMVAISEGAPVSPGNGTKIYRAAPPHPLQSLHFAAGPYRVRCRRVGSTTLYSYFFSEDRRVADGYLRKAAGYVKRYQQLIGPFPYPRYSIVENRLPTGYGMPGFTLLGQAVIRLPFIKDTSLGHEILHSWFGNSIRLADSGGNWCEGLTTCLADQSFAADRGEGKKYRKNQILRYLSYVHPDNAMTLADFQGAGDNRPMARKIRAIGYDKGSMFFHMLEQKIGRDVFIRGLRRLYKEKKYKKCSWQDIEQIFSRTAGKNLAPFFDQWLQRVDIPRLHMQQVAVSQKNGQSVISFHLIQDNKQPYHLRVPIMIQSLQGAIRKTVRLDQVDQKFSITTDTLPKTIALDPEYELMRNLADKEIPPTWSRFSGAEHKTVVLPADEQVAALYQPLADMLKKQGAVVRTAGTIKNAESASGSFLFAGSSPLRESLFADRKSTAPGFTLMVRKNPLNIEQTMVLVDSDSIHETTAATRKLSHYGGYSLLKFRQGKIRKKEIAPSENGTVMDLLPPPSGIPAGATQSFASIMAAISSSRVVYVGETHTAYGDHLLQLQVLQALYTTHKNISIGMEMFPRSSQAALDGYINGKITTEREFLKKSKYFSVWGFDYRLYRDIISFCRKQKLPIIGLNLDKKIVSKVFRTGNTDTITDDEQHQTAAIRDLDIPGYRERLLNIYRQHTASSRGGHKDKGFSGFLQAQAIWDETMAESISHYLANHPKKKMIVFAGTGHVFKDSAIPLRVARRIPAIKQSVLVTNNGLDTGKETGKQVDYLVFTEPMELTPAPKIGVILKEEKATEKQKGTVIIEGISPHGKGRQAGLKEGDIIIGVDGTLVHDIGDLKISLFDKQPGDMVTLKISRKRALLPDETLEIPVELTGMPMGMMMPPGHPQEK